MSTCPQTTVDADGTATVDTGPCPCGADLSVRERFDPATGRRTFTLYCRACENDDLTRLARSVGK